MGAGATSRAVEQTPWELLVYAGELPAANSPRCTDLEFKPYPPYPKQWWDLAWNSEQENTQQFQLLRQSRLLKESQARTHIGTPAITPASIKSFLHKLNRQRNLANIVTDGAIFSHINGNDAEAVGRVLDGLNIAACLRDRHWVLSQLVAIGIESIETKAIQIIAPNLRVSGASAAATRKETVQLIHELLDEKSVRQAWRKTFTFELTDAERPMQVPGTTQPVVRVLAKQVEHNLPLLKKAADFRNVSESEDLVKQCQWFVTPGFERTIETQFRSLAERRMAAVNLAVQLYRTDHHGDWPKALADLVPNYLSEVPADPYGAKGQTVGYQIIAHGWPDGRDRPVVFVRSGTKEQIPAEPQAWWNQAGKKEVWQFRDLSSANKTSG